MDAKQVANDIDGLGSAAMVAVRHAVGREGLALQTNVQRRASRPRTAPSISGLPPRLQTGTYVGSIGTVVQSLGTKISAETGTNAAQGMRLEKGFDDPGPPRQHTLPHPHFGPALDEVEPGFADAIGQAVGSTFR